MANLKLTNFSSLGFVFVRLMNILLYGELQNVNSLRNNAHLCYKFLNNNADP